MKVCISNPGAMIEYDSQILTLYIEEDIKVIFPNNKFCGYTSHLDVEYTVKYSGLFLLVCPQWRQYIK